jgi:hypothetical protein
MIKFSILFSGLILSGVSMAQTATNNYSAWEATVGANRGHVLATASTINYVNDAKFKVGVALRINSFVAKDKKYATAPAILTSGVKGPQAMFKPNILENIDTLLVSKLTTHSLNLALFIEYSFNVNFAAGFDIDLLGITLGGSRMVNLTEPLDGAESISAKPTRFNLLLVSDNDIGTLNSEFYFRFLPDNSDIYGKAGVSFYFSELTTARPLWFANDRFRYKTPLTPLLGFGYIPAQPLF